jgi:hypothetical protein
MILRGDLVRMSAPQRTLRVLWMSPDGEAVVIDTQHPLAMPEFMQLSELTKAINEGLASHEPYECGVHDEDSLSEASKAVRDKAWSFLEGLVNWEPAIYFAESRAAAIDKLKKDNVATAPTVYLHLRRYWQRGLTKNALLSDHANCGAPGKVRDSNPDVKRGRPRVYGDQIGMNVDAELRRIFQASVDKFYLEKGEKFTRQGAYDEMIRESFTEKSVDAETGLIIHRPLERYAEDGFPTMDQFDYWFERDRLLPDVTRRRMGSRRYDRTHRGLLGTSAAETWGPGSRYQIDATIADVFLVSRFNRRRIIGRPVLYIVIDVFSRMIVGLYVGLEGPSWVGAMMALANTAADKVAYCRQYGRIITPEDWQCRHLCATLLGDRGEIEATMIKMLQNNFNVTVETAAAYAAEWKGVVERRFRLLPAAFKAYVPGYIDVDYRARGGRDYRLDAVLDIDQFTKIIIHCLLYFNNQHEISRYDKDRDVAADGVPPIPSELWDWGLQHTSGMLRSFPEDQVRFCLLPVDQATVTVFGILFKGSYYTCAHAMEQKWFDIARQKTSWKVRISHDPREKERIYLHDKNAPGGYRVCTLTERSRAHQGLSLWEVEQQQLIDKHASANRRQSQQLAKADLAANIEAVVEEAAAMKPDMSGQSAASQTKNIQSNRAEEKAANRAAEAFRLGPPPQTSAPASATVIQFPGAAAEPLDYSELDITALIGPDGEDA